MRRKTRRWLALMGGLAMMTASLGVAGGAQAATHTARSAATDTSAICLPPDFTIRANLTDLPALYSSGGSTLQFSSTTSGDEFCDFIPTQLVGNVVAYTIYDTGSVVGGWCLALNSTTGKIYLHNPNGCGSTVGYLVWNIIPLASGLYEFQNLYAPAGDPCLYDINGAAEYGLCNPNSRADTFHV